jgi:hypothetical protein
MIEGAVLDHKLITSIHATIQNAALDETFFIRFLQIIKLFIFKLPQFITNNANAKAGSRGDNSSNCY